MAGELSITNEELEKMVANFEWNSDEESDLEEPYDSLSLSINAKVCIGITQVTTSLLFHYE